MAACLHFTRRVWKSFLDNAGHDARCFPSLQVRKATPGLVECSLKIESYNLNRNKTTHGGLLLSLVDTVGSLAVASKGHFITGVSTDISGSFLKPGGTVGETLCIKGKVVGFGRTLAYTRIEVENSNGKLVAYGSHTKYIANVMGDAANVKFSDDGEEMIEGREP